MRQGWAVGFSDLRTSKCFWESQKSRELSWGTRGLGIESSPGWAVLCSSVTPHCPTSLQVWGPLSQLCISHILDCAFPPSEHCLCASLQPGTHPGSHGVSAVKQHKFCLSKRACPMTEQTWTHKQQVSLTIEPLQPRHSAVFPKLADSQHPLI